MIQAWFSLLPENSSFARTAVRKATIPVSPQSRVHRSPQLSTPHPLKPPGSLARAETLLERTWCVGYLANFCNHSFPQLCQIVKMSRVSVLWDCRLLLLPELSLPQWGSDTEDAVWLYSPECETTNSWPGEKSQMLPCLCQKPRPAAKL